MAARFSVDPAKLYETLKQSVFPKATEQEMMALIIVANTYQLNVFLKELYAFPAKSGGIVPVVSVDGWNSLLIRQPDFDGIEFEFTDDEAGKVYSCTATVYVKNRSKPVKVTEFFEECVRQTEPWKTMPRRMLRNRTLCQASRMAFGISGVRHEEEVGDITVESVIMAEPKALPASPPPAVVPPAAGKTPQAELEALCITNGYTFDDLKAWGKESGNLEDADSLPGFEAVPLDVCRRLLRAQAGLLKGLAAVKEAK